MNSNLKQTENTAVLPPGSHLLFRALGPSPRRPSIQNQHHSTVGASLGPEEAHCLLQWEMSNFLPWKSVKGDSWLVFPTCLRLKGNFSSVDWVCLFTCLFFQKWYYKTHTWTEGNRKASSLVLPSSPPTWGCILIMWLSWYQIPEKLWPPWLDSSWIQEESAALNMPANLENSVVATGLEKISFHPNSKESKCKRMLKLPHDCTHLTC